LIVSFYHLTEICIDLMSSLQGLEKEASKLFK